MYNDEGDNYKRKKKKKSIFVYKIDCLELYFI